MACIVGLLCPLTCFLVLRPIDGLRRERRQDSDELRSRHVRTSFQSKNARSSMKAFAHNVSLGDGQNMASDVSPTAAVLESKTPFNATQPSTNGGQVDAHARDDERELTLRHSDGRSVQSRTASTAKSESPERLRDAQSHGASDNQTLPHLSENSSTSAEPQPAKAVRSNTRRSSDSKRERFPALAKCFYAVSIVSWLGFFAYRCCGFIPRCPWRERPVATVRNDGLIVQHPSLTIKR
eukprot:TRINITY_DN16270_c0_g2_i1.p1 TRINITY_DN16270_c0_g2~~TRINITY_DN16270_c0_g2_i1.p1  ORF type:complete len:238 (-),score=11.04 TRINITY_DN16270_c0_g2_i1:117-830(-)